MTKLIPRGNRLLVKNIFATMTDGGLHIPDKVQERRTVAKAEVLAVGDGVPYVDPFGRARDAIARLEDDPQLYRVGQIVLFMAGSAVAVDHEGATYLFVKTDEILGVQGPDVSDPELEAAVAAVISTHEDEPRLTPESFE